MDPVPDPQHWMSVAIIIVNNSADTCEQNRQQLTNKVREELVKRSDKPAVKRMFLLIKKRPLVKQTQQFVKKRMMRLRQMATDVKSPKQWTA